MQAKDASNEAKLFGMEAEKGRWILVVVGMAIQLCLGAIYSYSILKGPLTTYFKSFDPTVGDTVMLLPYIVFLFVFALTMPLGGPYMEKYGPRKMTMIGGVLTGLGWFLASTATSPILLAVNTGLRRGELLGLRWSDCDLKSGALFVNRALQDVGGELIFREPKTPRSRRRITLPRTALEALRQHRRQQLEKRLSLGELYEDNDLVICREDGRPWHPGSFSAEWRQEAKRLGLKLRWHDLRHTHATLLAKAGEHPKVVQERLGHASITTTMDMYSQVLPDMQERAAERFEALMTSVVTTADEGNV